MMPYEPEIEPPDDSHTATERAEAEIQSCNFRYAGRLSNDNARGLSTLFERFAANASNALEAYLGAALRLRLRSIDQSTIQDHLAAVALDSHLAPCTLSAMETNLLMELDLPLALPIIDLLLGGVGGSLPRLRDLTDIDEEILESVSQLFLREIEALWLALDLTYRLRRCIRPAGVASLFAANEKVVILLFALEIAGVTGDFRIVLPTSFVGYLLRHLNPSATTALSGRGEERRPPLRERILECQFRLSTDVTRMRVHVRDLLAIEPGQVIRMRAPVGDAGCLTVENAEVFRAIPVRSGSRKAAQVMSRAAARAKEV